MANIIFTFFSSLFKLKGTSTFDLVIVKTKRVNFFGNTMYDDDDDDELDRKPPLNHAVSYFISLAKRFYLKVHNKQEYSTNQ